MPNQNDIFISYAHVDNIPSNNADCGWVDYFLKDLKNELNRKFGRKENYKIWKDEALRGNEPLTDDILNQLDNSRTLLVFHSKPYQESTWCQRELNTFTQRVGAKSGRIFFIEQDNKGTRPAEHKDLLGYRFWEKTDSGRAYRLASLNPKQPEQDYLLRIGDVAEQLFETIAPLQNQAHHVLENPKATVYLAQVSGSLIKSREALMRELKQHGYQTVPLNHKPDDVFALEQQMQAELDDSACFVQLLDQHDNMGIPLRLFEIAQKNNKKILQWRPRNIDADSIKDEKHRQLLFDKTVMEDSLVAFQQAVLHELQTKPKPMLVEDNHKTIFINTGLKDFALAETLYQKLADQNYNCLLPLDSDTASSQEIREDLQANLQCCDVALLIYKNSPLAQIRLLLRECLKINAKRDTPLKTAICLTADNPSLGMRMNNMHELCCDKAFDEHCLEKLLQEVVA